MLSFGTISEYPISSILQSAASPTTFTITPTGSITFSSTVGQLHIRLQEPSGSIVFSGTNSFIRNRTFNISGVILLSGTAPIVWEPSGGGGGSVTTWRTLTGMGT
jgi:hypothetical protein